jgi:hypothetical protein
MNSQGQSRATIDKERRIGSALKVCMSIAARKFANQGYNYWHADLNAGSGINDKIGVPGTPLVFFALAEELLDGLPPQIFFAERERSRANDLLGLIKTSSFARQSYLFPHDNEEVIEVFAEYIRKRERPQFAIGSVLIDPNGWFFRNQKNEGAPVAGLLRFVKEFLRIDVVLNLNVRAYQMQRAHGHDVKSPRELMLELQKTFWLLSRAQYGGDRFIQMVGRNVETGDHKSLGIHKSNSSEGQVILDWADGSRQEELLW